MDTTTESLGERQATESLGKRQATDRSIYETSPGR
jgi:hypothetical protein